MNRKTRFFLILLLCFTMVYASAVFFFLRPAASQPFIAFGVYSDKGTLSDYTPGAGLLVAPNETLNWHLQVFNRMGVIQLIRVVFRLGNTTSTSPGQTGPALAVPSLGTLETFIPNEETATLDFRWSFSSVDKRGGLVFPVLQINNGTQTLSEVGASQGKAFKFMFEIWTYNPDAGAFQYGWADGNAMRGNWLTVWFILQLP